MIELREKSGVLYVFTCAAGPARDVPVLIESAPADGWDVCCILTPSARDFVDAATLELQIGQSGPWRIQEAGRA